MIKGTDAEYQLDAGPTKNIPYLALTGEQLGVFGEYLWENWPRFHGTALYLVCKYFHIGRGMTSHLFNGLWRMIPAFAEIGCYF